MKHIWRLAHGYDIVIFIDVILHGISLESIFTVLPNIILNRIIDVPLGIAVDAKGSEVHAGLHLLSSIGVHILFLTGIGGPIFVLIIITYAVFFNSDISLHPRIAFSSKGLRFTALAIEIQGSII